MFIYHYFFVKQVEGKVSDLEKQKKYGSTVVIICGSELATLQYSIVNKYSIVQNNRYLICLLFSIKVCTKVHGMYMANLIFQANIFDHY